MLKKEDLLLQRERMQEDLQCLFDGIEDSVLDAACQIIVDRMNVLIEKLEEK